MLIGICDDNAIYRNHMTNIIRRYESKEAIEIVTFCDGKEVLGFQRDLDILFLDIEMNGMNGLEVKEKLQDKNTFIIIITDYDEYALDGYGRNVIGFLRKEEADENVKKYLEKAVALREKSIILVDNIQSNEVLYVKAEGKYVRFRLKDGLTAIYNIGINTLSDKLADYSFVRVHKSFVVNLKYINQVNEEKSGRTTLMVGGDCIPISYRRKADSLMKYRAYLRKTGRYI